MEYTFFEIISMVIILYAINEKVVPLSSTLLHFRIVKYNNRLIKIRQTDLYKLYILTSL